jgi:hypothetical protein
MDMRYPYVITLLNAPGFRPEFHLRHWASGE